MKQILMTGAALVILAACGGQSSETDAAVREGVERALESIDTGVAETTTAGPAEGTIAWAAAGDWRSDVEKARDEWRNPVETLEFFGIRSDDTVVEVWPGGGWYSNVLAPYLASGGGKLIAATWDPNAFEGERRERIEDRIAEYKANYAAPVFGTVEISAFSAESGPIAPEGSVDAVLTFRNTHSFMGRGISDKFFADAYAALKPGGVLGVVQHRLPSAETQDPSAPTGYVHEDFVKALATDAGFEFVASSEINANPADTADHPFGVWTLPPNSRTTDREGNAPADFDAETYKAIGESDRMTLKFIKPS